jgi:U4/U6 small nuclear ribonucleoprotein PRP31
VTCAGKPLDEEALGKALAGCAMAVQLDEDKRTVRRGGGADARGGP